MMVLPGLRSTHQDNPGATNSLQPLRLPPAPEPFQGLRNVLLTSKAKPPGPVKPCLGLPLCIVLAIRVPEGPAEGPFLRRRMLQKCLWRGNIALRECLMFACEAGMGKPALSKGGSQTSIRPTVPTGGRSDRVVRMRREAPARKAGPSGSKCGLS